MRDSPPLQKKTLTFNIIIYSFSKRVRPWANFSASLLYDSHNPWLYKFPFLSPHNVWNHLYVIIT